MLSVTRVGNSPPPPERGHIKQGRGKVNNPFSSFKCQYLDISISQSNVQAQKLSDWCYNRLVRYSSVSQPVNINLQRSFICMCEQFKNCHKKRRSDISSKTSCQTRLVLSQSQCLVGWVICWKVYKASNSQQPALSQKPLQEWCSLVGR